jgi:hypothetical protein
MSHAGESRGLSIEAGCAYCTDGTGVLQDFSKRFERMTQWRERRSDPRAQAQQETLADMAKMPA